LSARRDRWEVGLALVNVAACAAALLALAAGAPAERLRPVAVFSGVGAAAALFIEVTRAFARRRALSQAAWSPPPGVRLDKPLWLSAHEGVPTVLLAAPLAALAALIGFPSTGLGVLITAGALMFVGYLSIGGFVPRALTFEEGGLRVHMRTAAFVIPWDAVVDVGRSGPNQLVRLRFAGAQAVLGSVAPSTERARGRAWIAIGGRGDPTNEMTFDSWTAGLDAAALARALTAASAREPSRAN
jgi:hypothetical protein